MLNIDNNPWLGLASYEYEDAYRFFGREKELERLRDCVGTNLITTIYGISGAGKTSVINAGMCPLIEKENYLPVRIRLEHSVSRSYSEQIVKAVLEAVGKVNGEVETQELADQCGSVPESGKLWLFFNTSTFWSATNHHLYPVVFIDQFEEIFTKNDNEEVISSFFEGVSALQYPKPPSVLTRLFEQGNHYSRLSAAQNFRVVLIMREDFLARLEDYAYDSPALRKNRVGIKRMNGNQALEVITSPVPGLVSRDVALRIIVKVTGREVKDAPAFLERLSVDTSLLSLFCSEVYLKAAEQKHDTITRELIDQFGENILSSFYTNTMKLVPKPTADYLETHLLTKSGYRNAVAIEDIEADGIHKSDLDKLCAKRLIRIETSEGTERVEFTHDVLCAIAKEHRDKAIEKNTRKQSNNRTLGFLIDLALPMMALLPAIFHIHLAHTPDNFMGLNKSTTTIGGYVIMLIFFIALLFNTFILFPYRHSRDRNAIFNALLTFLFSGFAIIGIRIDSINGTFGTLLLITTIVYYLIQFFNSFRFNRKRSFKQALRYTFRCQVYKDYPEMTTIFRVAMLIVVGFVSFLTGLSMNAKVAFVTAPLCSLASCWLLCGLFGQTIQFSGKAILNHVAQAVLVVLILASQFCQHHQIITLLSLSALLALTVFQIQKDEAPLTIGKKIRHVALVWLLSFAVIPAINAGYNIFNLSCYNRVGNGVIDNYKILRFLVIEDASHRQGVRDRWNLVVPVENDSVERTVFANFNKEELSGLLSYVNYGEDSLTNDIVFQVYKDGSEEVWQCSKHLDIPNKATALILRHMSGEAIKSSESLKKFVSSYKETIDPFTMELVIDRFIDDRDYNKDQRESYYSDKAFFTLFTGDFAKAEKLARTSLQFDSTYALAYSNLFDALYLQNKLVEAAFILETHQNDTINNISFKQAVILDFDDLANYGVIDESMKNDLESFVNEATLWKRAQSSTPSKNEECIILE